MRDLASPPPLPSPSLERGVLFVLSAPSGAGKTTIFNGLLKRFQDLAPSVSATTRSPRLGEKPGEDYDFMLPAMFHAHQEAGKFLESAVVYGHHYGTPRDRVAQHLVHGRDVLFDVDWQGARAIKKNWHLPERVVTIYILPPSLSILEERLIKRGTDTPKVIDARMATARHEIEHMDFYDYAILNDNLAQAMDDAALIVQAERALKNGHRGTPDLSSEGLPPALEALLSQANSLRTHAHEGLKEKLLAS